MAIQLTKQIASRAKPRTDRGPLVIVSPVDFSFCELKSIAEALDEDPRPSPQIFGVKSSDKPKNGKSASKSVKFNNNSLSNVSGLNAFVETFLESKLALCWLDLSFNEIKTIDPEMLGFPNLELLYLQGNKIAEITEVEKLAGLPKLKKLTLYGNPVATKNYRMAVISKLPQLHELDSAVIGQNDRATASILRKLSEGSKPNKKRSEKDDD